MLSALLLQGWRHITSKTRKHSSKKTPQHRLNRCNNDVNATTSAQTLKDEQTSGVLEYWVISLQARYEWIQGELRYFFTVAQKSDNSALFWKC